MKLKFILFFCFFILSINSYTQNINTNPIWKGEIRLNDGTVIEGFVRVPNNPSMRNISFRKAKNEKSERFRTRNIESVLVISESGKQYLFESVAVVPNLKGNASLGKSLLFVTHKSNYVTFYAAHGLYAIDREGKLVMIYTYEQGKDVPTLSYFIKKRDFEKARTLHMTNLLRGFRKSANAYFHEDPNLLKRINDWELRFRDIDEIIDIYLETTKNL